jgi:hypothetical protein
MDSNKRFMLKGGELRDYPGWWKIDEGIEGESEHWSFVRKPDGTYWEVVAVDLFPRTGGTMRVDLGEQITNTKLVAQCEEYYVQLQQNTAEEDKMKEGDRVRVIKSGVTGVIKGFGSLPGVPKTVNVAYDGGGGCNHRPEELEKIDGFTPTPR